jgi:hypothetical protein
MNEPTGEETFSAYVPAKAFAQPNSSLAELAGYRMQAPRTLRTYVTTTVEKAWDTPLRALSCEQVRMLVGQKFGLEWLAVAVAHFVHEHPAAEISYYPGDLTLSALRAFDRIEQISAAAAGLLRNSDYTWMAGCYTFSDDLPMEAQQLVSRVQQ